MTTTTKMKTKTMALFASLVMVTIPIDCLDLEQCRSSLGMQSLDIRDSALTASSSLDPHNTGPECARIRTEMKGGAWCPRGPISDESYEYLQIDLGELKVITLVETQGRFGRGQGQEYVEQYLLEYQRLDSGRWFKFKNRKGQQLFQGNTNTHVAELREVDPAVVARKLRFVPVSIQNRKVCLRVEIYGCKWEDGLLSYDLPQGTKRGSDVDLTDSTYDGHLEKGLAFGGLGQLTDGVEGHSNFRSDQSGLGVKGYEWVGWKIGEGLTLWGEMGTTLAKRDASSFQANHSSTSARIRPKRSQQLDSIFYDYTSYTDRTSVDVDRRHRDSARQADYLEMVFRFDGVRNFSSMRLHVNNQFTKDTRHFSTARVTFDPPSSEYLEFSYSRDSSSELARWISVPLEYRVATKLRVVLAFDSRWLLLSEVQFFSVPVINQGVTDGDAVVNNSPLPPHHGHHHHHHHRHHHHQHQFPVKPEMNGEEDDDERNRTKPSISLQNENIVFTNLHVDDDVIQADDDKLRNGEEFVGILVGALSVAILFVAAIFALMVVRKKRYGCLSNEECLTTNDSTKSSILVSIPRYLLKPNPNQPDLPTSPPNYPSPSIAKVVAGSDIEIKSSPTFNSNLYNKLCTDDQTESKDGMKFTSTPVTTSRNADMLAVNSSSEQTIIGPYVGDLLDQRTFPVDDRLSLSVKKDCLVFNPYETVKAIPSLYSNGTLKKKMAQHNREISPPNMQHHQQQQQQQQQHQHQHQQQQQQQQHSRQHKKQQQGLPTFQGDELRIVKKLGSSRFFDTFLCETCAIQSKYGVRSNWTCHPVVMEMARDGRDNMAALPEKVVLKALKACTNAGRSYFEDVVKTMNVLRCRDDKSSSSGCGSGGNNVLQLLGFYYNDLWKSALIFEHIRFGSLDRVLRRYSTSSSSTLLSPNLAPSTTAGVYHYQSYHHHQCVDHDDIFDYQTIGTFTPTRRKQGSHIFSYGSLMYLGSQIASAMSYLEKLQIVHGSLSCRACLVGPNLVIKLADFVAKKWPQEQEEEGVVTKYPVRDCDANKILKKLESGNVSCPLRWMAWEVVLGNKHAVKSDVWSFAVTLWELLTLSRDLPYSSLKDNQVVDLFGTFSKNISDAKKNDTAWHNVHLPKPSLCSSETYDLMSVCWSLDPSRRPSFEDIRLFLHQKVSGFRPLSEDVNILMDLLI